MPGESWVNSLKIDSARNKWHFKNWKMNPSELLPALPFKLALGGLHPQVYS